MREEARAAVSVCCTALPSSQQLPNHQYISQGLSNSNIMRSFGTLTLFVATALAQYTCVDDYTQGSFADKFDFFTGADPTNGYVNYVDYGTASSTGLFSQNSDNVYIGVDHNNTATGSGRDSVRISSKKSYQHGLIILDLAHMPGGACGTWPAFWLLSSSATWPIGGEVDIIEGVNTQNYNNMAIHTNAGCSISNTASMSSQIVTSNCDVNAANQATNQGCSIKASNSDTYGSGFNANGGGVYATEWTSNGISIWYFPQSSVPSDISSGNPKPSGWGTPLSQFSGSGCDWDQHIVNQQIVFDITFCGDWAGATFSSDSTCSAKASTCQSYVQNNPSAFSDTYWSVNSLKVYQENSAAATSSATASSTTSTISVSTSISTTITSTQSTTSAQTTPSVITTFVTLTTTPVSATTSSSSSTSTSFTTTAATTTTTSSAITTYTTSSTTTTTSQTTFVTTTTLLTTTSSTTSIPTTTYTTSYIPSSSSSWQTWTMAATPSAPYGPPANTFFTVTRPWGGAPTGGSWGPPGNSGPGGWGGHGGPGGPPRA